MKDFNINSKSVLHMVAQIRAKQLATIVNHIVLGAIIR
jgi:hypothetical protein